MKICSSEFRKILAPKCRCPQVVCCEMNIWWTSTPYCVVWIHLNLMSSMSLHSVFNKNKIYYSPILPVLPFFDHKPVGPLSFHPRSLPFTQILHRFKHFRIFGLWFCEEFRVWILFLSRFVSNSFNSRCFSYKAFRGNMGFHNVYEKYIRSKMFQILLRL